MARLALAVGADVPVCLAGRASRMSGIGEQLAAAPRLPDCGILLVNPGVAVATADVFRARRGPWSSPASLPAAWSDAASAADHLRQLHNGLEPAALIVQPVIGEVLEVLARIPGCHLARMSGSGATCFGLFDTPGIAARAAAQIRQPGWWNWGGALQGG
jgi:4-diphosphocytidyl-2-C-methyl-D-erythritol kinase